MSGMVKINMKIVSTSSSYMMEERKETSYEYARMARLVGSGNILKNSHSFIHESGIRQVLFSDNKSAPAISHS